jgi:excisionase family DNA binding protein
MSGAMLVQLTTDELAQLVRKAVRDELAERAEAPQFLRRAELAKVLNTSEKTIFRLMKEGLPAERLGSEWRFELGKVREFMRTRKQAG